MPESQDYPWRYFTSATLTLSALVLALLTVINGKSHWLILSEYVS